MTPLITINSLMSPALEIQHQGLHHMALDGIGVAERRLGLQSKAKATFEALLQSATEDSDLIHRISSQRHLAEIAVDTNEFDEALIHYQQLFEVSERHLLTATDHGNFATLMVKASDEALTNIGILAGERKAYQLKHLENCFELAIQQGHKPKRSRSISVFLRLLRAGR